MTGDESKLALRAVQMAWRREPMEDTEARQWLRMFLDHPTELVRGEIDRLIREGSTRPGPAEFASMLRVKSGRALPGARIQRPGPYLEEQPPPEDFSDRVAELRAKVRVQ